MIEVFLYDRFRLLLAFVVSACFISGTTRSAESQVWQAGTAKIVITPTEPVWMAGYAGRTGPSNGVMVDLYARSLALKDANNRRLVILALDLIEIPDALRERILAVAAKNHRLRADELLLNVSHTHGGPMVSSKTARDWGLADQWANRADEYVNELVSKVDQLLTDTLKELKPANVSYCHARCGIAMNRRQAVSGGFRLGLNPDGPVDHDVPVLRIESSAGQLMALVFGYACHNTSLGPTLEFNGDYAGFAQRKLEQEHPNTVALFLMGCGGDQDPAPRRHQADAEQNGNSLASAVEAALATQPVVLEPTLLASLTMCALPFAPLPDRLTLEQRAASPDGFVSRHARWILREWPKEGDQPADYHLPVQVIALGSKLMIVALGGEPVVDYALRFKSELATTGRTVWVCGYSNLVNAYLPNRRVLLEGGYEGTEAVIYQSLPGPFRLEVEQLVADAVHRQVEIIKGMSKAN